MRPFDLIVAQLEAAKHDHLRKLNQQLFASGYPSVPEPQPSRRDRFTSLWRRVRDYVVTLLAALCGDDLVPPHDGDGW